MRQISIALAGIALVTCSAAQAWNARGHKMVAAVAWSQLEPATQTRVSALLRLNPNYAQWVEGIPLADRDRVAFMEASVWPDDIKRAPYINDGNTPPNTPQANQNIGYSDQFQHRYWHYKNLPFSTDGTPLRNPPAINAGSRIQDFTAAIGQTGVSDAVKSYDLAWLIHLVGDVHQPLHAVGRFTSVHPRGDSGGNQVEVCIDQCDSSNDTLHGIWDGAVGSSERLVSIDTAVGDLPAASQHLASVSDVNAWLEESRALARRDAYRSPVRNGRGPYRLTAQYRARAGATAERQISLAGARLANLLDNNLR